ncbi:hypothetical protein BY996DRAFT_6615607, partial [Phakopsora pachyrhizi]
NLLVELSWEIEVELKVSRNDEYQVTTRQFCEEEDQGANSSRPINDSNSEARLSAHLIGEPGRYNQWWQFNCRFKPPRSFDQSIPTSFDGQKRSNLI